MSRIVEAEYTKGKSLRPRGTPPRPNDGQSTSEDAGRVVQLGVGNSA